MGNLRGGSIGFTRLTPSSGTIPLVALVVYMILAPIATLLFSLPVTFAEVAGGLGAHIWAIHALMTGVTVGVALWKERHRLSSYWLQVEAVGLINTAISLGLFSGYVAYERWQGFMTYGAIDVIIVGVVGWRLYQLFQDWQRPFRVQDSNRPS